MKTMKLNDFAYLLEFAWLKQGSIYVLITTDTINRYQLMHYKTINDDSILFELSIQGVIEEIWQALASCYSQIGFKQVVSDKEQIAEKIAQSSLIYQEVKLSCGKQTLAFSSDPASFDTLQATLLKHFSSIKLSKIVPYKLDFNLNLFKSNYNLQSSEYLVNGQNYKDFFLAIDLLYQGQKASIYLAKPLLRYICNKLLDYQTAQLEYNLFHAHMLVEGILAYLPPKLLAEINIINISYRKVKGPDLLSLSFFEEKKYLGFILLENWQNLGLNNTLAKVDYFKANLVDKDMQVDFPLQFGYASLSLNDLSTLNVGDILLLDNTCKTKQDTIQELVLNLGNCFYTCHYQKGKLSPYCQITNWVN